jgi:iron(III) transport system substrate-binding protein
VVVYTSVDQNFSEPILETFESQTGIRVLAVYDVEATKTTGLVNRLIAEREVPQADVFWNGEFAQTVYLKQEGVLTPYRSPNAEGIPANYIDPERYWTGFAGRARVLIVNTELLSPEAYPESIFDLLDDRWPADQIGIAYPIFGTTSTQAAALYALLGREEARAYFSQLQARGIQIVDGNSVVRDMVAGGQLAFGLTDTDDACGALKRGAPVRIIFPDQGEEQIGTLIIPNTVGLVAGGPNPENGQRLIDYLLSGSTTQRLIDIGWSHIDLGERSVSGDCFSQMEIRSMDMPLAWIYQQLLPSREDLTSIFIR